MDSKHTKNDLHVDSMETRDVLPSNVYPIAYSLSLFDLELDGPARGFRGTILIDLVVRNSTQSVVLNARELSLESAQIVSDEADTVIQEAIRIGVDERKQRCSVEFGEFLASSSTPIRLRIEYRGKIDDQLTSFYRFEDNFLAKSVYASPFTCCTQFQPSDARQAFPCFDEPGVKATFQLSIEVPAKLDALSNTPVEKRERSARDLTRDNVTFERTPLMSTYLVAWAIGGFEYIETTVQRQNSGSPLPIRVYTPPGLKEKGQFALTMAGRCVEFFSQMFGIDFPLPKLDLLGVLELSDDAMENWGLITFRTTALLVDEQTSNVDLTRCLYILAHEIAHSWFGNLVTMSWWDELWLNEGFATWAGWMACDKFYPEWDVLGQFINDDMEEALMLDSLESTHPVHVHVPDGLEVDSIFDSISYLKSASIIRMLAAAIGDRAFVKGVANYLQKHAFQNTVGKDLWTALSETSGRDVESLMKPWIRRRGFPLVEIEETSSVVSVRQEPYTNIMDGKNSEPWSVPLRLLRDSVVTDELLLDSSSTIEHDFIKANADQGGFYRVLYSQERLTMICGSLAKLAKNDQVGVLNDMCALAYAGHGVQTTFILSNLAQFATSKDFIIWQAIISAFERFQSIFGDDTRICKDLDDFAVRLAEPHVQELGWTFRPAESYNTKALRVLLISFAGLAGDDRLVSEACGLFDSWMAGKNNAVHPWLRPVMLQIAVKTLGSAAVDRLLELYDVTRSYETREEIVAAIGQVGEPQLAERYLRYLFEKSIAAQDLCTLCEALAANPICRSTLWSFMRENWSVIFGKIGHTMALFNPFIQHCLQHFATEQAAQALAQFFENMDLTGFRSGLSVARARIEANVRYREKDGNAVKEWLRGA